MLLQRRLPESDGPLENREDRKVVFDVEEKRIKYGYNCTIAGRYSILEKYVNRFTDAVYLWNHGTNDIIGMLIKYHRGE